MPKLKRLSAKQILGILAGFGFRVVSARGSHAKLCRETAGGSREILTVPLHPELAPGAIQAIYRQVRRFIPEAELRPHFYSG